MESSPAGDMTDALLEPLRGGCKCGVVRFELTHAPIVAQRCHCRDCHRLAGAALRINLMIERDCVRVARGAPVTVEAHDGRELRCSVCQHPAWAYHRVFGEAIGFVAVGLPDAGERLPPEAHFFTRPKHPGVELPAGVPAFETRGDPGKRGRQARVAAALERAGRTSPDLGRAV